MSYEPWHQKNNTAVPILGDQTNMVQYSQRPKVFLNPTTNEGGILSLPFFHYNNWINTLDIANFTEMGLLSLNSFQPLQHSGGGSDNITITVFAWAEDVKLCVPTTTLAAQAGKGKVKQKTKVGNTSSEYGDGIISKPASAVAEVAGALEHIPIIAPFAMATRIGANAISGIARLFGFSRPIVLSTPQYYKPQFCTSLATCDSDETTMKLTADSKQEITLDPRTVGLAGLDELAISYITQKESYYTQFSWSPTYASDSLLFSTRVAPMLENVHPTDSLFFPTALSFATFPFKNWSGSLKFRFQIVASGFHHGRLQFSYEPTGTALSTSDSFNTVYNEIVDISCVNDFEMEVAWAADTPYKQTTWNREDQHFGNNTFTTLAPEPLYDNGIITVRVLSELTAPTNTAAISINVFISAGDDFELKNPDDTVLNRASYHPLIAQSGMGTLCNNDNPDCADSTPFVGTSDVKCKELKSQIFFGQNIVSFRTLLRRYNKYRSWYYRRDIGASGTFTANTLYTPYKQRMRGYNPTGLDLDSVGDQYDYVNPSLFSYLLPAYIGYRGSMRVKMRSKITAPYSIDISKMNGTTALTEVFIPREVVSPTSTSSAVSYNGLADNSGITGTSITPSTLVNIVEVERPFFTGRRFAFANNSGLNDADDFSDQLIQETVVTTTLQTTYDVDAFDEYRSIGEDFNCFFFLNAPPRWEYTDPPPI